MNLTDAQLTQVRQLPHSSRIYLSIFQPETVFDGQITGTVAKNDRTFSLVNTGGVAADVVRGMTAYVGTTPGGSEVGRLRAIEATASTVTLAENSQIDWQTDYFITVVRFFEPWGVYPRITLDDDNVPTFFKDFDIVYVDQNQEMDPVVNMGPNHAGFLLATVTGSYAQVFYNSSGSFNPTPGGSLVSALWEFEGGTPTGSTSFNPGFVDYTGCGHFTTSLALTTSEGKTFTGFRHISILDRPEAQAPAGTCKPFTRWGFQSFVGSREAGGYEMDAWIRADVPVDTIRDGSLCVVFTEDQQGYVPGKVGANAENRDGIFFVGYIKEDTILLDPITNRINFKIQSITNRMEDLSTFSAALDSVVTAFDWNQMREMTMDRGIIHFLRWHSSISAVADFSPTNETKDVEFLDFSRGSIFSAIDSLLGNAHLGDFVADRQGKMWAEVDARMLTTGSARQRADSMQDVLFVSRQDWRDQLTFPRMKNSELSFIELGGIAYSGPATGTFFAHLAGAPGNAPDYYGVMERRTGLIIAGQDQINELTGHALAARNADFPDVFMPMAGDYRFLDIAPQHRVLVTLEADENFREGEGPGLLV